MAQDESFVSTKIGQLWMTGMSQCLTDITKASSGHQGTRATYWQSSMSTSAGDSTDDASFYDLDIQLVSANDAFDRNTDYYLYIKIPQDQNYDYILNVRLMKRDDEGKTYYQNIKEIEVLKGGSGQYVYNVVLFEDPTDGDKIKVAIAQDYTGGTLSAGVLYRKITGRKVDYLMGNGTASGVVVANYNDIQMTATWKREAGEHFAVFEFVFRPIEEDFCDIVFQMQRDASDYNTQTQNDDGTITYGRIIDINNPNFEYHLYKLVNLISGIDGATSLDQIGIWGRPGLPMSINGEEIFIPKRGYYELDTLPITSISVVPEGPEDFFTLDYRYTPSEE